MNWEKLEILHILIFGYAFFVKFLHFS